MLKVDNKMEELFLSDSIHKNLTIEFEGEIDESLIPTVNFYTGDIYDNKETTPYAYASLSSGDGFVYLRTNISNPNSSDLGAFQNLKFKQYKKYIYVSYTVRIVPDPNTGYYPNFVKGSLSYYHTDGNSYYISIPISSTELLGSGKEFGFFLDSDVVKSLRDIGLDSSGKIDTTSGFKLYSSKIQIRLTDSNSGNIPYVKSLYIDGIDIDKYINHSYDNITNSDIIQESFSLTESLCSQKNLKFGLCESAHCEFEVVERYEKFIGKTIMPYISPLTEQNFDYSNIDFNVGNASEAWIWNSGNLKNIFPWNLKINSDYLAYTDYVMLCMRVNILSNDFTKADAPPFFGVGLTLQDQQGNNYSYMLNDVTAPKCGSNRNSIYKTTDAMFDSSEPTQDWLPVYVTLPTDLGKLYSGYAGKYVTNVTRIYLVFLDENQQYYTVDIRKQITISSANIALYFVNDINEPSIVYSSSNRTSLQIKDKIKGIPLGVFKISEVKKNNTQDIIKKSITAYDRMSILDQDVGDWLTKYMWITDTANKASSHSAEYTKFGVEYVRQMYSTYKNLMKQLGFKEKEHEWLTYADEDFTQDQGNNIHNVGYNYIWPIPENRNLSFCFKTWSLRSSNSVEGVYRVTTTPLDGMTDEQLYNKYMGVSEVPWDPNFNGISQSGGVLVTFKDANDNPIYKIVCDSGDLFYVPYSVNGIPVKGIDVNMCCNLCRFDNTTQEGVAIYDSRTISHYKIEKMLDYDTDIQLVNAHIRLVYYNYGTQEVGSFDSSVSARDVIRSLLEVNGCFFHMNRYGKPEIIYASKAGLYPSEKLYPREDLYPRGMNGPLLSMSRYISMECDDYVVENYGKIQIKTQSRVKNGESICSYEYVGNPDGKNTYIIEDNIFYCAEGTVYEYGSQPEVDEMLKNLFDKISNLTYTPHTTKLRGLPFMECGDRVNLVTKTGGIESFIFRRTLKGIHALMDTYEAEGDEYNEALNTFDYKVYTPT